MDVKLCVIKLQLINSSIIRAESCGSRTQPPDNSVRKCEVRPWLVEKNKTASQNEGFSGRQDGAPALAAFYVHFKLSVLATSHYWPLHCERNPLCCKRDEMGPVEKVAAQSVSLFVRLWPSNDWVVGAGTATLSETATRARVWGGRYERLRLRRRGDSFRFIAPRKSR